MGGVIFVSLRILTLAILLNAMYYVHGLFLGLLQVFFYCGGANECIGILYCLLEISLGSEVFSACMPQPN